MSIRLLRYGTRGSALALAQASWVAARLQDIDPATETRAVAIVTSGDRFADGLAPPPAGPAPNVKALFVREIEEALLRGDVDFAVHSAKDLPAELPEGLVVAAVPPREDPRDAYVGGPRAPSFARLPAGARVGTSALRRRIQLLMACQAAEPVSLRGNVDTRLSRLREGKVDGLLVARAGLKRLGVEPEFCEVVPEDVIVPAPGQGALAVEARADRPDVLKALAALEHAESRREVDLERAFMRAMGGGCRSPLGARARREGGQARLMVFWSDGTGARPVRLSAAGPRGFEEPEAFAREVRERVLDAQG